MAARSLLFDNDNNDSQHAFLDESDTRLFHDALEQQLHSNPLEWSNSRMFQENNDDDDGSQGRHNEASQETFATQPSQQEILTQQPDLTQLFDEENSSSLSPLAPGAMSPLLNEREQPWGRLMPCINSNNPQPTSNKGKSKNPPDRTPPNGRNNTNNNNSNTGAIDLLPRSPDPSQRPQSVSNHQEATTNAANAAPPTGISLFGLHNLHPSDIFNQYTLGRSPKCDIPITPGPDDLMPSDPKIRAMHEWAHAMISNRHCRIYCRLQPSHHHPSNGAPEEPPQMVLEDCSGNGTLVNRTTLLRKGQTRLLHSGDEICLANPDILSRRIHSQSVLQQVLQQHSFIFVNLWLHSRRGLASAVMGHTATGGARGLGQPQQPPRSPAVNVRALKHHSKPHASAATARPPSFPIPSARQLPTSSSSSATTKQAQPRRFEEDYEIRDLLGSGTVGQVYRAIHRQTGVERAVKRIAWNHHNNNSAPLQFHRRAGGLDPLHPSWQAEVQILQQLSREDHPYIVRLVDVYGAVPSSSTSTHLHLVMELLPGGDLFDRIILRERYTEDAARRLLRRILAAVAYLHNLGVVHRDLKPENILMVSRTNDIEIKVTDFGLAKSEAEGLKTFCGTPQYFAPEVLQRQATVAGEGRYGKPADMWSVGVILYVLLSGTPPFDSNGPQHLQVVEFPSAYWKDVSETAKDLVRCLLVQDPRQRYTVAQACHHEWILMDDGDTHTFPLDDPKLKPRHRGTSTKDASVAHLSLAKVAPDHKPNPKDQGDETALANASPTRDSDQDEKATVAASQTEEGSADEAQISSKSLEDTSSPNESSIASKQPQVDASNSPTPRESATNDDETLGKRTNTSSAPTQNPRSAGEETQAKQSTSANKILNPAPKEKTPNPKASEHERSAPATKGKSTASSRRKGEANSTHQIQEGSRSDTNRASKETKSRKTKPQKRQVPAKKVRNASEETAKKSTRRVKSHKSKGRVQADGASSEAPNKVDGGKLSKKQRFSLELVPAKDEQILPPPASSQGATSKNRRVTSKEESRTEALAPRKRRKAAMVTQENPKPKHERNTESVNKSKDKTSKTKRLTMHGNASLETWRAPKIKQDTKANKRKVEPLEPADDAPKRARAKMTRSPTQESQDSRRVSDSSCDRQAETPPRHPRHNDGRSPLSHTNVNSRPQTFREKMVEQAKSETKSKNKPKPCNTDDDALDLPDFLAVKDSKQERGEEDELQSQFSQQTESIASFNGDSRDTLGTGDVATPQASQRTQGKESEIDCKNSLFAVAAGQTKTNKRKKPDTKVTEGNTSGSSSKRSKTKSAGGKQTTLAAWCTK